MILERMFEKRDSGTLQNPADWLVNMFGGGETSSGEKVNADNALSQADVFSCVQILSDDVAKLPVRVYKKSTDKIEQRNKHPVSKLIYRNPNKYMTAFTWKKLMMTHLCLRGNAYSYIERDKDGRVKAIIPLHPSRTQARIDPNTGKFWYESTVNGRVHEFYPEEILHYKGMSDDGINGKSPITVIREQVGAQSAATKYNAKFYGNDATTKGVLKVPTQLSGDAKSKVRDEWEKVNEGESIAVIDAGLEYESISMNMEDAQFVESMKFNKLQIANIFKIPPHKVNDMDGGTFNNVESQSIGYLVNTIQPWVTAFEQENDVKLFTEQETDKGIYTKFNTNAMLRTDSQSRSEYYKNMIEYGIYSLNEVRDLEEMNAIENGDEHRVDLNHIALSIADDYQMAKASGNSFKGGDED